ncbi:tRNA-Thr(GGU) m(6)t(6)A37 methyltransferase TsaA [Filomicrobium insigne]|uniref:tRNA-Thr(GGU) m(6)t(6)A37 methyltransferase TsaA n=1 Tax=Filomicrobium insigne TaxID=418854 RepID=A0A1H0N8U8_9HYPH|nr:tRNA (N6-threonylcarbamoyladenosine(37)-N6)-methyltransferase TrmO [Filomicrobium insigne]SDO88936.1 tRNA-Thr(GGU) m(6)t(6)A37 methyltransferase TsaA [Filomicrobium insigne]
MVRRDEVRNGEKTVTMPETPDAGVVFIGRIHTPWTDRLTCPRLGRMDGPICRIEIFEPWVDALKGIDEYERLEVLYWLHQSRRDLILQSPKNDGIARGAFSLRSPVRPNPIGTQNVKLVRIEGPNVFVQSLDCLDGTPLLDLKPDRDLFTPIAPRQTGDDETRNAASGDER